MRSSQKFSNKSLASVDSKLGLHCHDLRGRTEAVLGAHVQTVSKVLHQISCHHIAASASITRIHGGRRDGDGVPRRVLCHEVRRNDESASALV